MNSLPEGIFVFRGFLSLASQDEILAAVREVVRQTPLFLPCMSNGTPFKYTMSNCGKYGWISDRKGYRYTTENPRTNQPWPAMPDCIQREAIRAAELAGESPYVPETCLINFYASPTASLGIHRDTTERNQRSGIISFSLGDAGIFQVGGFRKDDPKEDIVLHSGDCLVMNGASRMRFHAFKRTIPNTGTLPHGGRINLTIRTVD